MATITPQQAIDILEARGVAPRFVQGDGWYVHRPTGQRIRIPAAPTILDAVEAAESELIQEEARAQEHLVVPYIALMQQGRYFHRTRSVQVDDGVGGTAPEARFDMIRANGSGAGAVTALADYKSVKLLWRDLKRELDEGRTP